MTPEQWNQVSEWFGEAMDADADQRARIVETAERESPPLAAELRALLREHDSPQLRTNALNGDHLPAGVPLENVGPYRILRELGRGGTGIVFLAERADDEFHRPVALKLLRYAAYHPASEELLTKERRALSQLQHPHIAALLDWGVTPAPSVVPWLAIEYVDGEPVDAYCKARSLDANAILALFGQVCQAVQYAHRRLIVHSDLKPGNIFVKQDGTVKLLDFGISKLMDPEGAAYTRDSRFTPAYASPEQFRGEAVTVAVDVYALGLLLYELLTGSLPGSQPQGEITMEEMLRRITQEEPCPPSEAPRLDARRRTLLRGDLDRMILHALHKNPERRYETVEAFAEDVRRYAGGYPISVRPPGAAYLVRKFARRNAMALAVASVLLFAVAGGAGLSLWQASIAKRQQKAAERRFQELQSLAHSVIFDLHDSIRSVPGTLETRRLLVGTALKYLDALNAERVEDDALQLELAAGYFRMGYFSVGGATLSLGDTATGRRSFQSGLKLIEEQWRRHPESRKVGAMRFALAYNIALNANDPPEGLAVAARYGAEADAWVRRDSGNAPLQAAGLLHQAVGRSHRAAGATEDAVRAFDLSIQYFERLARTAIKENLPNMVSADVHREQAFADLSRTHSWRAVTLLESRRFAEAEESRRQFRLAQSRMLDLSLDNPIARKALLVDRDWRLMEALEQRDWQAVVSLGRAALANIRVDETNITSVRELATARRRLGVGLCARGQFAEGLPLLRQAVTSLQTISRKDPTYVPHRAMEAGARNDYASALLHAGRREAAAAEFTSARELAEKALLEAPNRADLRRELARARKLAPE